MAAIVGTPQLRWERAAGWAASRGAPSWWCDLAELAWIVAPPVRPEVLWAQACKETGFGRFGGVIDATYRNTCGMKKRTGGSNTDPYAHHRFPDWPAGWIAHRDHLALYAGAEGFPREQTFDPRHFDWLHYQAPTVEDLSGRWAPSSDYGLSIVRDYLTPLLTWG